MQPQNDDFSSNVLKIGSQSRDVSLSPSKENIFDESPEKTQKSKISVSQSRRQVISKMITQTE